MRFFAPSRRGAGTTEYLIILALAMGLGVLIFWSSARMALVKLLNDAGIPIHLSHKTSTEEKTEEASAAGKEGTLSSSGESGGTETAGSDATSGPTEYSSSRFPPMGSTGPVTVR